MTRTFLILGFSFLILGLATADFDCEGLEWGIYPDPDNCQRFYQCSATGMESYTCPIHELFNDNLLVCDHDYAVDCGDRPRPDNSTNPPTKSTTPMTTSTTSMESSSSTPTEGTTTTSAIMSTTVTSTTSEPKSSTTTTVMETSTSPRTTTTSSSSGSERYPNKVMGIYILLADDTEDGFHTDDDWNPKLYPYQQDGANVLFFTFINPETMKVPKSFEKLAKTRGTSADGAVPKDTVILFAIGGYLYSIDYNPWHWLTSREAAEAMAVEVATWPDRYGCDGIDLDIEEGAGSQNEAGQNLVHFVNKLRTIKPDMIIGQPTYGYPQVKAEIDVINFSWNTDSSSNNVADSVGLMVYEGTQALSYVKNYVHGTEQWEGFPIKVDVDSKAMLLGCKGSSSSDTIMTLAKESVNQNLLGIMVWYASVQNGFQYEVSWDASTSEQSKQGYIEAMTYLNDHQ